MSLGNYDLATTSYVTEMMFRNSLPIKDKINNEIKNEEKRIAEAQKKIAELQELLGILESDPKMERVLEITRKFI